MKNKLIKILCKVGIHRYGEGYYAWHPYRYEWQCKRCGKKRVFL